MKFFITNLISFLIFPILVRMFLNCIVCKMYKHIGASFEVELRRRGPDVAFGEPVGFDGAVEGGYEHVVADVEFSSFVE